jgi:hypothetical protein
MVTIHSSDAERAESGKVVGRSYRPPFLSVRSPAVSFTLSV